MQSLTALAWAFLPCSVVIFESDEEEEAGAQDCDGQMGGARLVQMRW